MLCLYIAYYNTEKPTISECKLEDNQCDVSLAYNPHNTHVSSEYYHIEWVEFGFHESPEQNWVPLLHKDGYDYEYESRCLVTLPPTSEDTHRDLKVAVKYVKCSTPIFSEPYKVEHLEIRKFLLLSI